MRSVLISHPRAANGASISDPDDPPAPADFQPDGWRPVGGN
jgi:hypothetical protein